MNPKPLILASNEDINAALIKSALQHIGVGALHAPSAWHPELSASSVQIDNAMPLRACGGLADVSITAVWNRRRRAMQQVPGCHPADAEFLRQEWQLFHENVFALQAELSPCLWANAPIAARDTENKLLQLKQARALGFNIAPTLVSDDPEFIHAFIRRHQRVVYKAFMSHTWKNAATGSIYNVSVPILEPGVLSDDAALRLCPGIYQKYIEKRADLRVTVIGDQAFAVRIQRDDGKAFVDWRPHTLMSDLIAKPCALPSAMLDRLQALMRALGITYGAIDLVEDHQSDLHFLEVNQTGQFLFVQEWVPELPILGALACMLAQGRVDYTMADVGLMSLARCKSHDIYLQWHEQYQANQGVEDALMSIE